jgi:hypothetical protein
VHYNTVAKWLRSLETLGIIKLAPGEVRKTRKKSDPSPHYVYLGLPPPELEIGPAGFRPALPTSLAIPAYTGPAEEADFDIPL